MVWGVQSWNGGLPVGQLIAFINYITQLLMSMLMLSNMLTFFSRAKVSADRENEVFSTISEITEVANAKKMPYTTVGSYLTMYLLLMILRMKI